MKICFMGTPAFAVPCLKAIHKSEHEVLAVITAPDKVAGRGKQLKKSDVKLAAEELGIPLLQPTNLKSEAFLAEYRVLEPDLNVVVAFRMLPELVWNFPALGSLNLHASLLPNYRGAAPIHWAVMNGEKKSGISIFLLKHEIDTGDILLQHEMAIGENETTGELYERMMYKGADLLVKSLDLLATSNYKTTAQIASYELQKAPKIFKEDCRVKWNNVADNVHNFIRGLSPFPAAWSILKNDIVKCFKSLRTDKPSNGVKVGSVLIENNQFFVACSDFYIELLELQLAGKKRLRASEIIRGRDFNGLCFE